MDDKMVWQTARALRFAMVYNQWKANNLTLEDAQELLRGELSRGDPDTFMDDSALLVASMEEIDAELGLEGKLLELRGG